MLNTNGLSASPLSLKSYSKDIPPGWRPRAYPLKEYVEALKVWQKLATLPEEKWGAAIMSRLDGQALKLAQSLSFPCYDPETNANIRVHGVDALSLPWLPPGRTPQGVEYPRQGSGIKLLIDKFEEHYGLDDQDKAWTAIDRFFSFRQSNSMDFQTYHWEWQHLYDEAETQGGL